MSAERRPSSGRGGDAGGGNQRGGRERAPRAWISAARLVAYDVLRDVEERDAYANLALPAKIRAAGLDARDAALATELTSGTLRGRGRYDRIIELAADRPTSQIEPRTLNVLRLGVHQLLSMRVGPHAAVNESVELQRRVAIEQGAGFVNGVLRAISRADAEEWDDRINDASESPEQSLAQRSSHPEWVLRAMRASLAAEGRANELGALLQADNEPPRVSLAALPGLGFALSDAELDEISLRASGPSPVGLELAGGDPVNAIQATGAVDGAIRVQDQGSQLAALILTRAKPVAPGERWLDLCAGPGGKTALLGAEAAVGGATVRANEISQHRAELVRRAVSAVADHVEVVSHDGREDAAYGGVDARFDRILVDAPCSGLGALRRRPEARWRKQPAELPPLRALQGELLEAAAPRLADDGVLAYVTCSPHLDETRSIVESFLTKHPEFHELDAKAVAKREARGEIDLAGTERSVQLWPHRTGTDAMFVALLARR